jgi:hypothetical protein
MPRDPVHDLTQRILALDASHDRGDTPDQIWREDREKLVEELRAATRAANAEIAQAAKKPRRRKS